MQRSWVVAAHAVNAANSQLLTPRWHRLRYHQGLGNRTVIDVFIGLLTSLAEA